MSMNSSTESLEMDETEQKKALYLLMHLETKDSWIF